MLKEETLQEQNHREYEEPEGEIIEIVDTGTNTITVLTRVNSDKVRVESPPIDPADYTVSDLEEKMEEDSYQWNKAAYRGLLRAEKEGKNRTTAIDLIEEKIQ